MPSLSRRTIIKASPLAAIAFCIPERFRQATTGNASPQTAEPPPSLRAFIDDLLERVKQSRAYTLEFAAAMPEEKYGFRPVPEVRSFGQQLVHIAEANGAIMEVHVKGEKDLKLHYSGDGKERVASKADVIAQLNASYDYIQKGLSPMIDAMLRDPIKTEMGEFSRLWGMQLILDHATHHRGQAVVYLRLNGIKPPEYRV